MFGSAATDTAVRAALLPRMTFSARSNQDASLVTPALSLADSHLAPGDPASSAYVGLGISTDPNDPPIAVTTLRPSALNKIQEFLIRGERRSAYHYALDQRLWAHAMIIASSIDKDAWKEVASEFIKTELGTRQDGHHAGSTSNMNRGPLRVAYSLYSGQGPTTGEPFSFQPSYKHPSKGMIQPRNTLPYPHRRKQRIMTQRLRHRTPPHHHISLHLLLQLTQRKKRYLGGLRQLQ